MKYFTIAELTRSATATARGIDNTPTPEVIKNLTALVDNVLDPARERYGGPIPVSCGYRCTAVNKAVGGVANSQHLRGEAADIDLGSKESNRQFFEIVKQLGIFDQLINEHNFDWIHVSFKRTGINRRQILKID